MLSLLFACLAPFPASCAQDPVAPPTPPAISSGAAGAQGDAADDKPPENPLTQFEDNYPNAWTEVEDADADGAALLARAAAQAGAERFAMLDSIAFRCESTQFRMGRRQSYVSSETTAYLGGELRGRVEEPSNFDTRERPQRFAAVVNGDDRFCLMGLKVLGAEGHEAAALAYLTHELVTATVPLLLHRAGAVVESVSRCELQTFAPKAFDADSGASEYEATSRTWTKLHVRVPEPYLAPYGAEVDLYLDSESGRLAALGIVELTGTGANLYGTRTRLLLEIVATEEVDGLVLPKTIDVWRYKDAGRMERRDFMNWKLDPPIDAKLLKRP